MVFNKDEDPGSFYMWRQPRYWGWERNRWAMRFVPGLNREERGWLVAEIGNPGPEDEDRIV